MRLNDYLRTFSVEDLRELAARRGVRLSQNALNGRQTLVQILTAALSRTDSTYAALSQLNQAELGALQFLLHRAGRRPSLSGLVSDARIDAASARTVLESLRLWGLIFPEGDWEQIALPPATIGAQHYLRPGAPGVGVREELQFAPPALEPARGADTRPRTGSFGWDQAELLARIARSRMRLTQAGRINRRDLKSIEPGLTLEGSGYATFVYMLCGSLGLLSATKEGILTVPDRADAWLAQDEETRARALAEAWEELRAFPESLYGDPAEYSYDYVPASLPAQRMRVISVVGELPAEGAVTLDSVARRLLWQAPLAFRRDSSLDVPRVTQRFLRSLCWLGLIALDDSEKCGAVRLTPLGRRVLVTGGEGAPALVPEDPCFFAQPNAEVFAPPNLAPRSLFHLRRISGEKKGGPAGMYPLTADSVRRGLDSGLTMDAILAFLERYSRTGLPGNVRALVETAGRQYGRILLVPTGYVIVTDTPELLKELRSLKTVEPLVGREVTERVAALGADQVPELVRRLRARGYAPLNLAEVGEGPGLPDDPVAPAPDLLGAETDDAPRPPRELDWSTIEETAEEVPPPQPGPEVTGRPNIHRLMQEAAKTEEAVEIEYAPYGTEKPTVEVIWPLDVYPYLVLAFGCDRGMNHGYYLEQIRWARRTGEKFASEYL